MIHSKFQFITVFILVNIIMLHYSTQCSWGYRKPDYVFYTPDLKLETSLDKPWHSYEGLWGLSHTIGIGYKLINNIRSDFSYTYDKRKNDDMSWQTKHKILRKEYKCNKNCETALALYEDEDVPDFPVLSDIPESASWSDLKKELYEQFQKDHEYPIDHLSLCR